MSTRLSIGQCATMTCLWEVTIPKPGNVHRAADFEDVTFADFATSAVAIGTPLDEAAQRGVGQTVFDCIERTRELVGTNTNLGAVLLLAPLAAVPRDAPLRTGVREVLSALGPEDSRLVYAAIRHAAPGGLGQVARDDVSGPAPADLLSATRSAADRDLVARQYANGYLEVFEHVVPWLREGLAAGWGLGAAVRHTFVRLMQQFPDSLIARKCGQAVADQSAARAGQVLSAGAPGDDAYEYAMADLDFWLRSDGHRRNPGTSADLIAAGLFVLLRDGIIEFPVKLG